MKKIFASFLSLLLAGTLMVSALTASFAIEEAQAPLFVDITSNRNSFMTLGVATLKVTVTNISEKAVHTVSAELLGGQLAPLGSKSIIAAESACLLPGESIGFTFKATLNKDAVELDGLQRFGLSFVRFWYKNMPIVDNGFDDGRTLADTSRAIKFGNYNVSAVIRVWYTTVTGTIISDDIPEVVAFYNEHANAMKTYPGRVTVTKWDGTTSKINHIAGGSVVYDLVEDILPNDYGEKPTLTFANGLSGTKTLAAHLPRGFSNLMSELDPSGANGVKSATHTYDGGSHTVTIIMNDDITSGPTALSDKPAYVSKCMDTMSLRPEDLAPFSLANATANYTGCKIEAVFDFFGRMTKLDVTTPVQIVVDLEYVGIRLTNTDVVGTYNGNYTFAY